MPDISEIEGISKSLSSLRVSIENLGLVFGPMQRHLNAFARNMKVVGDRNEENSLSIDELQKNYKNLSRSLKSQAQDMVSTDAMTKKLGVSQKGLTDAISDVNKSLLEGGRASAESVSIYKNLIKINAQYTTQLKKAEEQQKALEWATTSTTSKLKEAGSSVMKVVTSWKTWLVTTGGLSLGIASLGKTLTTYNRTVFESTQMSAAYGRSLDDFNKGQEIARRSTTLSSQAFAEINKSFQEMYVGIPPTTSQVALFASALQNNLGYSAEVTAKKIQDLLSLQQRMPDIIDRVQEAMQAYNRSSVEGDKAAASLYTRMRTLGMSLGEMREVMITVRAPTTDAKELLTVEKTAAELEKARRDAEKATAEKLENVLVRLNNTLAGVAKGFGNLHKSVILTGTAMLGLGAVIPILSKVNIAIKALTTKMIALRLLSGKGGLAGGLTSGLTSELIKGGVRGGSRTLGGATAAKATSDLMGGILAKKGIATGAGAAVKTGTMAKAGTVVLGGAKVAGAALLKGAATAIGSVGAAVFAPVVVAAAGAALVAGGGMLIAEQIIKRSGRKQDKQTGMEMSVRGRTRGLADEASQRGFFGDQATRTSISKEEDLGERHRLLVSALDTEFKSLKTQEDIKKAAEMVNAAKQKGLITTREVNKLSVTLKSAVGDRKDLEQSVTEIIRGQTQAYNKTLEIMIQVNEQSNRLRKSFGLTVDQTKETGDGMLDVIQHFQQMGVAVNMTNNELDTFRENIRARLQAELGDTREAMKNAFVTSLQEGDALIKTLIEKLPKGDEARLKIETDVSAYDDAIVAREKEQKAIKDAEQEIKRIKVGKEGYWAKRDAIARQKVEQEAAEDRLRIAMKVEREMKAIRDETVREAIPIGGLDDEDIGRMRDKLKEINDDIAKIQKSGGRGDARELERLTAEAANYSALINEGAVSQEKFAKKRSEALEEETRLITANAVSRREAINVSVGGLEAQYALEKEVNFGMVATQETMQKLSQQYIEKAATYRTQMDGVKVAANDALKEHTKIEDTLQEMSINLKDYSLTQDDVTKQVEKFAKANEHLMLDDEKKKAMVQDIMQQQRETIKLRQQEQQIMGKHVQLTKEVREGWLAANKEFIANAGVFSGIIPTMERALTKFGEASELFRHDGGPAAGMLLDPKSKIAQSVKGATPAAYDLESKDPPPVGGAQAEWGRERRDQVEEDVASKAKKGRTPIATLEAMMGKGEYAAVRQKLLEDGVSSDVIEKIASLPPEEQEENIRKIIRGLQEKTRNSPTEGNFAKGGMLDTKDPSFVISKAKTEQYKDIVSLLNPTIVKGGIPGRDSVHIPGTSALAMPGEAIVSGKRESAIAAMINEGKIKELARGGSVGGTYLGGVKSGSIPKRGFGGGVASDLGGARLGGVKSGSIPKRGFGGGVPSNLGGSRLDHSRSAFGAKGLDHSRSILPRGGLDSSINIPRGMVRQQTQSAVGVGSSAVELKLNPEVRDLLIAQGNVNYRSGTRY
jgi:hypothetical protein